MAMITKSFLRNDRTLEATPSGRLLYQRVREKILQDLLTKDLSPGERYGTETELAERLNVGRNTIRKAIADLEQEGYLSRRQRVGAIVGNRRLIPGKNPMPQSINEAPVAIRHRVIVILPPWNNTVEGFYTGKYLRALSAPTHTPPFAVEIRHHNDVLSPAEVKDASVIAMDPDINMIPVLQDLADRGVRVIADGPKFPIEGLVNLFPDRRTGVRQMTKELYRLGHRAVGLVNHDPVHMNFREIYLGFLDAHRELDLPIHPRAIVQVMQNDGTEHAPDVRHISGWLCSYLAAVNLVARECQKYALSIPRDVALISMDDPGNEPMALVGKSVTVSDTNCEANAAIIHDILNDWREDRRGTTIPIPCERINRETVAPPPDRAVAPENPS